MYEDAACSGPSPERNALAAFVAKTVPVARVPTVGAGDDAPVWIAAGPLMLAVAGGGAKLLPSPHSVLHGWVVKFGKHSIASLDATLQSHADLFLILAGVSLALAIVLAGLELPGELVGGAAALVGVPALVALALAVLGMLFSVAVWCLLFGAALMVIGWLT
jgi:hypothetical protein